VTGGKGGVGTTTVAVHLAAALARQSDRVLLVDADPDRTDVATLCGLAPAMDLADLVVGRRALDEVAVPGPEGILVVSGAQPTATDGPAIERFHAHWLAAARDAADTFDCVVVDTGNGSSRSVKMLWESAEAVLLVTTTELPSVLDAYASIKTLADRATPPAIHTLVNHTEEPAAAYDVHGRLARAVWRFLGFHLESAGHLGVAPGPWTPADSDSPLASDFDQLARRLRATLRESTRTKV